MTKILVKGCALGCIFLLTACGDGSSPTNTESQSALETEKETIAIDNAGNKVISKFNDYKVMVYTDKVLIKETSHATKPVYGHINGESTLLSISDNYTDGDVFSVKVFDGDELVGESDEVVLDGDVLEFGDVDIDGGER